MTGISFRMRPTIRVRMSLKEELKIAIESTALTPDGICPDCGYRMDEDEIRAGWRDDPRDYTTECPECGRRFISSLIAENQTSGQIDRFQYLCKIQLFDQLRQVLARSNRRVLGGIYLHTHHPELLFNMIRHFGRYDLGRKAFGQWLAERV